MRFRDPQVTTLRQITVDFYRSVLERRQIYHLHVMCFLKTVVGLFRLNQFMIKRCYNACEHYKRTCQCVV